jgi:DNA-binding transcriptional MocR family regulator
MDALINPGDTVALESPSPQGIAAAFASRGAKILEIPIVGKNLNLDNIKFCSKKPKVFYLTHPYQSPTGLCYNNEDKAEILKLAHNLNAYIIEEDTYSDFFYGTRPVPLKAADIFNRVIYIKSFDKILAPGLAGCMVCPTEIINRLQDTSGASGYIQRSLDFYLRNCDFNAFCAKMRSSYNRRYKRAVSAAETFLAPMSFIKPQGGLSLWITGNDCFNELYKRKVLVSPGELFSSKTHFRISFANASEDEISTGIGIIASVLKGR